MFSCAAQQPNLGLGRLIVEVSRPYTIRHTQTRARARGRTPLNEWSARHRGRYLHNTKQIQTTNNHALSEILTHDISNQGAADPRLRPHRHQDRLSIHCV